MKLDLYHALFVTVTQAFLGSYVMLMIDFREPKAVWRKRWIVTVVAVVCANVAGLLFLDFWETYQHVGPVTMTLPYILITVWCSRYRDFRAVFGIATALFVGCVGTVLAVFARVFVWGNDYFSLTVRSVTFLVMFFILRRFSVTYRDMLRQIHRSWGVLCVIPIMTFLCLMYLVNHPVFSTSPSALILLCCVLVLCGCAYYLMYLFFERVQKENSARHDAQLSSFQLSALQSRMEAVKAAGDAVRMERHDLRHRLQTVAELVARGDREETLQFLDAAQKRLDEYREVHWCSPPVLDAVFSSYFNQAVQQDIEVDAKIALPDRLPVEEGELAIVLANALENAIQANQELPYGHRKIRCRMVGTPSVMLEISNPCSGSISFDSDGLPQSGQKGHGLGVQSIFAFCRKTGAVYKFDMTDGWFRLRLVCEAISASASHHSRKSAPDRSGALFVRTSVDPEIRGSPRSEAVSGIAAAFERAVIFRECKPSARKKGRHNPFDPRPCSRKYKIPCGFSTQGRRMVKSMIY